MHKLVLILVYFVFSLVAPVASYAAFKCTQNDGSIVYQDNQCNATSRQSIIGKTRQKEQIDPLAGNLFWRTIPGVSTKDRLAFIKIHMQKGMWTDQLANGKVAVGMSKELALTVKGMPDDVNKTESELGTTEQWVYVYRIPGLDPVRSYIYIKNGKVSAIQNQM